MLSDEDIIRMSKENNPMTLETKVGLAIVGVILFFVLITLIAPSDNKPSKTALENVCEKIDKGQELNWLDKKVLDDALNK